jgi:hypothetical protein
MGQILIFFFFFGLGVMEFNTPNVAVLLRQLVNSMDSFPFWPERITPHTSSLPQRPYRAGPLPLPPAYQFLSLLHIISLCFAPLPSVALEGGFT